MLSFNDILYNIGSIRFYELTFAVQTSPEGHCNSKCNETNICDRYSCVVYLIPTKIILKTSLKHKNIHFLSLDFSKQNGAASNFGTSLPRHNVIDACNVFAKESIGEMISQGRKAFPCSIMQTIQG